MMEAANPNIDPVLLRQEAQRAISMIRENLGQHDDDDIIETNVRSLRNLANIIEILLKRAPAEHEIVDSASPYENAGHETTESRAKGEAEYWVPLPFFQTERTRNQAARSENDAFRRTLQAIAQRPMGGHEAMAILLDWEQIAREFQDLAYAALATTQQPAGMGRKAA